MFPDAALSVQSMTMNSRGSWTLGKAEHSSLTYVGRPNPVDCLSGTRLMTGVFLWRAPRRSHFTAKLEAGRPAAQQLEVSPSLGASHWDLKICRVLRGLTRRPV